MLIYVGRNIKSIDIDDLYDFECIGSVLHQNWSLSRCIYIACHHLFSSSLVDFFSLACKASGIGISEA
jgi:hypothetical protein